MKNRRVHSHNIILSCLCATICAVMLAGHCQAAAKDFFSPEIDRAVDDAISAWVRDDRKVMTEALRRLIVNEARLLAAGISDEQRSYLRLVPLSCNKKPESVVACLYLLREQRRRGMDLLHNEHFFAGGRFIVAVKDLQGNGTGEVR